MPPSPRIAVLQPRFRINFLKIISAAKTVNLCNPTLNDRDCTSTALVAQIDSLLVDGQLLMVTLTR
ncbi:MAG: hypothetical protein NZ772_14430 [Cyanobacteria bacterium]|nr:hypothetical protein [Cyanobacteriota bacterium]